MNITKESEQQPFYIDKNYIDKVRKWWDKQGKKMQSGLTFLHIDEERSYKGLTFKEIETIYKQYNKD